MDKELQEIKDSLVFLWFFLIVNIVLLVVLGVLFIDHVTKGF